MGEKCYSGNRFVLDTFTPGAGEKFVNFTNLDNIAFTPGAGGAFEYSPNLK